MRGISYVFSSVCVGRSSSFFFFFFFNDTATTEIYTLSLHDALPISSARRSRPGSGSRARRPSCCRTRRDRKSIRLNSSHTVISYAVFCLKKKKKNHNNNETKQLKQRTNAIYPMPLHLYTRSVMTLHW